MAIFRMGALRGTDAVLSCPVPNDLGRGRVPASVIHPGEPDRTRFNFRDGSDRTAPR